MNLMFVEGSGDDATLVTPALSGSLLAGITRKSLLQVAEDAGLGTEERKITVEQWREGVENGTITETLACGTAAVLTPVGRVRSADGEFTINTMRPVRSRCRCASACGESRTAAWRTPTGGTSRWLRRRAPHPA